MRNLDATIEDLEIVKKVRTSENELRAVRIRAREANRDLPRKNVKKERNSLEHSNSSDSNFRMVLSSSFEL